jgi:hypothetical protein
MRTRKIKKIQISIPTSLDDIPLGAYQEFMKVAAQNVSEKGEYNEGAEEIINAKALEHFCNVKPSQISALPMDLFNEVLGIVNTVLQEKPELKLTIEIQDQGKKLVKLGFIPNMEKMTYAEFVDLNNYLEGWENAHKMMAVLYRPITQELGHKYAVMSYEGTDKWSDLMKAMPVSHAIAARLFFYGLMNELSEATLKYLPLKQTREFLNDRSLENGDGTFLLTSWLGAILQNIPKLKNYLTRRL